MPGNTADTKVLSNYDENPINVLKDGEAVPLMMRQI